MLSERRVGRYEYDGRKDEVVLTADGGALPTRAGDANLLLDGDGALCGVDLRGDGGWAAGEVWMLGPHESVKGTRLARVEARGDKVAILRAKAHLKAPGANPYVG